MAYGEVQGSIGYFGNKFFFINFSRIRTRKFPLRVLPHLVTGGIIQILFQRFHGVAPVKLAIEAHYSI
jgi:hypothetical protein